MKEGEDMAAMIRVTDGPATIVTAHPKEDGLLPPKEDAALNPKEDVALPPRGEGLLPPAGSGLRHPAGGGHPVIPPTAIAIQALPRGVIPVNSAIQGGSSPAGPAGPAIAAAVPVPVAATLAPGAGKLFNGSFYKDKQIESCTGSICLLLLNQTL
jgi:hypothetical protein